MLCARLQGPVFETREERSLTCRPLQFEQNSIEAKKGIVASPSMGQRSDSDNAFLFEEGEVYGLNIQVTNGEKTVSLRSAVFRAMIFGQRTYEGGRRRILKLCL